MIYGEKEYKKSIIQRNREDYEAITLRKYQEHLVELHRNESDNIYEIMSKKLTEEVMDELNIPNEKILEHKILILNNIIEDDEREWREQKYGKQ